MSGFSNFESRVRVGIDNGIPTQDTRSEVALVKRIEVSGGSQLVSAAIPSNARFFGAPYLTTTSAFAVSAGTRISLGTSGNINKYATVTLAASAASAGNLTVSAANMAGDIGGSVVVAVSAVSGSNPTVGSAAVHVPFILTQNS